MHFYIVFHSKYFLLVFNITASQLHYRTLSNFPCLITAIPRWRIPGFPVPPTWRLFCIPYWFFSFCLSFPVHLCFLRWDSGKSQFPKVFIMRELSSSRTSSNLPVPSLFLILPYILSAFSCWSYVHRELSEYLPYIIWEATANFKGVIG